MKWFAGSVQDAVNLCKKHDGLMIIFVRDKSALSDTLTDAFTDKEIDRLFEERPFLPSAVVLLRIEHATQDYHNLHSIYPVTSVPMIQFIDARGFLLFSVKPEIPADILSGLREGITTWLKERAPDAATTSHQIGPLQAASAPVNNISSPENTATQAHSSTSQEDDIQARIVYAQKRAAEIREKKEKEAQEAEKEKEAQRRRDAKLMAQAERDRADKLAEQTRKDLEKERREEQAHRQKVLEQLKQDREARLSRETAPAPQPVSPVSSPVSTPLTDYSRSRIQFRLETAEGVRTFVGDFNATDALVSAFDFVRKETQVKGEFSLMQMYPRRDFGKNELKTTLRFLGLVPSAVLVVVPAGGSLGSQSARNSPGFFQTVISSLRFVLALPLQGLNYLVGVIFPRQQIQSGQSTSGNSSGGSSDRKESAPKPRSGNLRQRRPSNEATYNGNSTQQL